MLPGYDTYSIAACRLQCEKEAVVRSCHCRMVHMPGEGCAGWCGGTPLPHQSCPGLPRPPTACTHRSPLPHHSAPIGSPCPSLCTQGSLLPPPSAPRDHPILSTPQPLSYPPYTPDQPLPCLPCTQGPRLPHCLWGSELRVRGRSGPDSQPLTGCFSTGNESICSPNVYIECADHTLGRCSSGWEAGVQPGAPREGAGGVHP